MREFHEIYDLFNVRFDMIHGESFTSRCLAKILEEG